MQWHPRYRILRTLGRGGMAEVLEAVQLGADGFERRVAIKRILPEAIEDAAFTRMFLDEARLASRLHHANIVGVLDYGVVDELPFQVLELVDGSDARALVLEGVERGRPMPTVAALHVAREVAFGLHHAHEATDDEEQPLGIVHRDVSPSNVLIGREGEVRLADFGIAFAHDRHTKTQTGTVKGKLTYMAPEQALGDTLDRRADIFALGCTLHMLLRGKSPLTRPALMKLLKGEALALDEELPAPVREVLGRALAADPDDRFSTALEMADALRDALKTLGAFEPKDALRSWLRELEEGEPRRSRPAFVNDLVGVVFELSARSPKAYRATTPPPPPAASPGPPGSRYAIPLSVLAIVGVTAVALYSLVGLEPEEPETLAVVDPAPPPAPEPEPEPELPRGADVPPLDPSLDPEPEEPTAAPDPEPRRPLGRRRAASPPTDTPPDAPPVPAAAGPAFVQFVGARAASSYIFLDGARARFGLNQSTVGAHRVRLRTREGDELGPYSVQLSPAHSQRSPLRWSVPEPP